VDFRPALLFPHGLRGEEGLREAFPTLNSLYFDLQDNRQARSTIRAGRAVRANRVYRVFTRIGEEKVPAAKTLATLSRALPGLSPYGGNAVTSVIVDGMGVDGFHTPRDRAEVFTG